MGYVVYRTESETNSGIAYNDRGSEEVPIQGWRGSAADASVSGNFLDLKKLL
jgi:hypothetical protein